MDIENPLNESICHRKILELGARYFYSADK